MRRNCRMLFKWLLLTTLIAFVFKFVCDRIVETFLSSNYSLVNMKNSHSDVNYESLLIAWTETGQRSKNGKLSMETIPKRDDLQFIGAQVVFRHGARTPLNLLPSLEEVIYSKEQIEHYLPAKWEIKLITKLGNKIVSREKISSASDLAGNTVQKLKSVTGENVTTGQLTAVGERQLFELGRRLRAELIDENENSKGLLPAIYDRKYVYCRSTFMDRTVNSARCFLAGLFSSEKTENKIQANGPFEIEVHHFLDEDMFPNPKLYPILNKCHTVQSLYASLNDNHDLKKARLTLLKRIRSMEYSHGIIELYDDIVSRLAHNFSVPEDILKLTKDFEIMSGREFVYRGTNIGFDQLIRSTAGPLLYLIRENFNSILKNYLAQTKEPYQKLFIYSGHDSTLIPLAMAFEIFDMRWPKYAAYILIKYYISKTDPNKTYITLNFADEPQILPNCDDYYCAYSTFLKNLQNRFDTPKIPANI